MFGCDQLSIDRHCNSLQDRSCILQQVPRSHKWKERNLLSIGDVSNRRDRTTDGSDCFVELSGSVYQLQDSRICPVSFRVLHVTRHDHQSVEVFDFVRLDLIEATFNRVWLKGYLVHDKGIGRDYLKGNAGMVHYTESRPQFVAIVTPRADD